MNHIDTSIPTRSARIKSMIGARQSSNELSQSRSCAAVEDASSTARPVAAAVWIQRRLPARVGEIPCRAIAVRPSVAAGA